MTIISLLLLTSLLPHLTFTARVNVGIVNGKEAKPHSRPYMVSVQVKEQHICGGFLISDRFVMTAAHCRENYPVLTVVLGAHNLRNKNENSVRIKVESYHPHPQYTGKSFHNDILLLRCFISESSLIVFMMTIISLLLLASLLPHLTFTAHVNVGIVNGWEAKPHSRLYMVSVQKNWLHTCGGFLVFDEFVLTAAHCREKYSETLTVLVGAHDLKNKTEGSVCIGVKSYHKHPNFTKEPVMSDIMLLRLEKKLTQNEKVNWISIPVKEEETEVDSVCSVAGWGRLDTNGFLSSRLMETHVKIMNNTECENKWGQDDYSVFRDDVYFWQWRKLCRKYKRSSLEKKLTQNEKVNWISIPVKEEETEVDSVCSVAGWGRLDTNGFLSSRLMETHVKIMNNTECENKWGQDDYSVSEMMCTFGNGGSCTGDSGGPLVCEKTAVAHVNVGIVNGTEAKPHSRPYMVSLQKGYTHVCGGFLISDRFVMTAAHCIKHVTLTAVIGAHDLTKSEGSVRIGVKSYHKHPDYNIHTFWNDIMLLRLEKEVEQNKIVKIISIPTREGDIKPDSVCSVAGWGRLSLKGKESKRLMEADVKIMNNTECENRWKKNYSVSQMMCVYGHGGSCSGDSGGPLVCGDTAVGVTSFGGGECNSRERPEVYTKISAYLPWIHSIIANVK
ncbi:complement factor D-like protein [Labeo rohita]|uniref:trypsin n=1 Tax=Labeo rohita TaxID=84645 RepID=A0A498LRU7_LABRO|nr:complement factor D-like protein [Labeo rohita]